MQVSEKQEFTGLLTAITEVYGKEFTQALYSIWFESLKDYSIEQISLAISKHIKSPEKGSYPPKPADIIFFLEGTSTDSSFLAWTKVIKAIETVGVYSTVVFDDPIIHLVMSDMGGWIGFGDIESRDMTFKAIEFQKRYRGYKERKEIRDFPKKMIGLSEADNARRGYEEFISKPTLIGDSEKALEISGNTSGQKRIEQVV